MITAEHLEKAENVLKRTYKLGIGNPRIVYDRARIAHEAGDALMAHHKTTLFKEYMPEVDPRVESSILTMFMHFLAVGAIAQRISEGHDS
jgi:hypothetical protein